MSAVGFSAGRRRLGEFGAVLGGLLVVALTFHALADPHGLYGLTEYDDAVYLGAAVRLVDGAWPYRDFAFVQPPGITLLLTPIAGLSHLFGTREAMVVARVATGVVAAANALLAGWIWRRRSALAAFVAAIALGIFPTAYFADHTVLLEPYVVFFCLLGACLAFADPAPTISTRRLFAAGVAFGFAGTIKLWAVVPFVAFALALVFARKPARLKAVFAGAAIGFVAPCLPFFLAAPSAFIHDIATAQALRVSVVATSVANRIWSLVGLRGLSTGLTFRHSQHLGIAVALIGTAVVVIGGALPLLRAKYDALQCFALLSAIGTVAVLFVPTEFYPHYAYFSAAFISLALGGLGARAATGYRSIAGAGGSRIGPIGRTCIRVLCGGVVCGAAFSIGLSVRDEWHFDHSELSHAPQNFAIIARAIPPGACVLSDAPGLIVAADRFISDVRGCPVLVDADGEWLARDAHSPEGVLSTSDASLVSAWRSWFDAAQYVVLSSPSSFRIPWTAALRADFVARYRPLDVPGVAIYARITRALTG